MTDDIILEKTEIIENCLKRVFEVYEGKRENLYSDFTKQDSIFMNIERACQSSIDLAMHLVRLKKLGIPKESREAFDLLEKSNLIAKDLSISLKKMVGFRNMAVHRYRKIDLVVVEKIINSELNDLKKFTQTILNLP